MKRGHVETIAASKDKLVRIRNCRRAAPSYYIIASQISLEPSNHDWKKLPSISWRCNSMIKVN